MAEEANTAAPPKMTREQYLEAVFDRATSIAIQQGTTTNASLVGVLALEIFETQQRLDELVQTTNEVIRTLNETTGRLQALLAQLGEGV